MMKRDIHPDFAATQLRALLQEDADLRNDDPALWCFARIVTWLIHPWACLRLWWMGYGAHPFQQFLHSRIIARRSRFGSQLLPSLNFVAGDQLPRFPRWLTSRGNPSG
jgi:hypothetical protein